MFISHLNIDGLKINVNPLLEIEAQEGRVFVDMTLMDLVPDNKITDLQTLAFHVKRCIGPISCAGCTSVIFYT